MRWLLGALGALLGVYGGWLLLSRQDADRLLDAATWLVAGVVVHDLVLAPLWLLVVAVAGQLLPRPLQAPALVVGVVVGAVTLLAVPVLGRFGARADNPTLLDRDYALGWLAFVAVTVGVVAAAAVVRSRQSSKQSSRQPSRQPSRQQSGRRPGGPGPGGR
ncbi:hypothetical protein [Nocardioides sp. SYSU D00038]|uniref:hypothetical protein n=1 Tax=Nocardioides sp. SYSU D00038 TaxID=2812554 RepID=UPI0019679722|nr:hypothetical protein [Nocardioides sp. SYSU D00038]